MMVRSSFSKTSGENDEDTNAIDILSAWEGKGFTDFSMAHSRHELETRKLLVLARRIVSQPSFLRNHRTLSDLLFPRESIRAKI
jgi:hypothetical protein